MGINMLDQNGFETVEEARLQMAKGKYPQSLGITVSFEKEREQKESGGDGHYHGPHNGVTAR